jgi:aspartate aminotransferase-like enzyme
LNCEAKLLTLVNAPADSRVIFLTASGTAAMEAVVMNILDPAKAVAVVNGGSFGQRFVDICSVHGIPIKELIVDRDSLSDCRHITASFTDGRVADQRPRNKHRSFV